MRYPVLSIDVDATSYAEAAQQILGWAQGGESRYVCVANVHMVMEAWDNPDFSAIVNGADLVVPDGMPLVWMLRLQGRRGQERVYGPHLTLQVARAAAEAGVPIGLYGGTTAANNEMAAALQRLYPGLQIVYRYSPPFRPLDAGEEAEVLAAIRDSGARILFVGLGCPKQERWMAAHRGQINAVMLGVGAAFDFIAGVKPWAPAWVQRLGLEWLFRLLTEPRRLWRRYLYHNPRFMLLALAQMVGVLRNRTGER